MARLSPEELERARQRYANSAIGKSAELNEREAEVLTSPDLFRLHRRDGHEILRMTVTSLDQLRKTFAILDPSTRHRILVYAIKNYPDGERSALIPWPVVQRLLSNDPNAA